MRVLNERASSPGEKKEERPSFLKKRSKRLLFSGAHPRRNSAGNKSFLVLFFKKERLSFLPSPSSGTAVGQLRGAGKRGLGQLPQLAVRITNVWACKGKSIVPTVPAGKTYRSS
jgi:hypothetical protein